MRGGRGREGEGEGAGAGSGCESTLKKERPSDISISMISKPYTNMHNFLMRTIQLSSLQSRILQFLSQKDDPSSEKEVAICIGGCKLADLALFVHLPKTILSPIVCALLVKHH